MTGHLGATAQRLPLSALSIAFLADMGCSVDLAAADPYELPTPPPPGGALRQGSPPELIELSDAVPPPGGAG